MTPVHTPKQVSAEDIRKMLAGFEWQRDNASGATLEGDEVETLCQVLTLALDALTRRSSAGVKVTDEMVERFHQFLEETGAWVVPRITIRAALTAALALPSHAGEDDGAVKDASLIAMKLVNKYGLVGGQAAKLALEIRDAMINFPSPSVPPQGETSGREYWMHYDHQTGRWIVDEAPPAVIRMGAEVIHVREITPSPTLEPSDAEVERMRQVYLDKLREYDRDFTRDDKPDGFWERKYGTNLHSTALGEAWAMRAALIASRQPTSGEINTLNRQKPVDFSRD